LHERHKAYRRKAGLQLGREEGGKLTVKGRNRGGKDKRTFGSTKETSTCTISQRISARVRQNTLARRVNVRLGRPREEGRPDRCKL